MIKKVFSSFFLLHFDTKNLDAPPPLPEVPEHATYILVGAGTASFAAYRAIRKADKTAKVISTLTSGFI